MTYQEHPFSWKALIRIVLVGLSVYFIWHLGNVIEIVLLSLMLSSALYPVVSFLHKKIPLILASVLVVGLLFLPLVGILATLLPNFINQFPSLLKTLADIVNKSSITPGVFKNFDITQYAQSTSEYVLVSTSIVTSFVAKFFGIVFLTLYILIDFQRLKKLIVSVVPDDQEALMEEFIKKLAIVNGQYIRGILFIASVCGSTITIGLLLLNIPYAIPLGILAGILDLLPLIGIFLAIIPAAIIGFAISPTAGLFVLLLFLFYQQIEGNILAPSVYKRTLNMSPAISFVAILIGVTLFGIVGAFIALPIAASTPAIIKFINKEKETELLK